MTPERREWLSFLAYLAFLVTLALSYCGWLYTH